MSNRFLIIIAAFAAALLQAGAVALGLAPALGGESLLAGPDSYMRLLQAERLWMGGGWGDRLFPLTNAPFGEVLHWTRPFDVLLLAGAWPLTLAGMEIRDALQAWGHLASPALQLVSVGLLAWGSRPAIGPGPALAAAVLFCIQPLARSFFMAGQPDHHSLQLLLFVGAFSVLLRMASEGPRPRLAWAGGLAAGLALWVSVEGLATFLLVALGIGLQWLWKGDKAWLAALRRAAWAFAGLAVAAVVLDRPPEEWLRPEYDRPSVVHATLALGVAAGSLVIGLFRSRLLAGLAGGAVPILAVALFFPRFLGGPFVDVDPRMAAEWSDWIGEAKPLWRDPWRVLFELGPVAVALPAAGLWLRRAQAAGRLAPILCLAALTLLVPLGLSQLRLAAYAQAVMVVPWAWGLAALAGGGWRPIAKALAVPALLFWHVPASLALAGEEAPRVGCPWTAVAPTIRDLATERGRRLTILSYVHQGPEIVYRTGQAVVGSPYQRNHAGVLDTHAALRSTDLEAARRVIAKRRVDLVVLCREASETERYRDKGDNLFHRAFEGGEPSWLRRLPLSGAAARSFVILEAVDASPGSD